MPEVPEFNAGAVAVWRCFSHTSQHHRGNPRQCWLYDVLQDQLLEIGHTDSPLVQELGTGRIAMELPFGQAILVRANILERILGKTVHKDT